jgi:hypothetical protein
MLINQIQKDFSANLLDQKNTAILEHIRQNKILPECRLHIYRNTIFQNLCRTLELTFPAIWKLVGKECADGLALAFVQKKAHLPMSNCLDDWGEKFPLFLRNTKPVSHLVYLHDIAQLDWLKHLSYGATDHPLFDPILLQKALEDHIEKLRLRFNPSVFLHSSSYALKAICDLIDNPTNDKIQVQSVPSYVVIARHEHSVFTHWISKEQFTFLNLLKKRCTLLQSYEYMLKKNPDFNLAEALQFMIKNFLLHNLSLCQVS